MFRRASFRFVSAVALACLAGCGGATRGSSTTAGDDSSPRSVVPMEVRARTAAEQAIEGRGLGAALVLVGTADVDANRDLDAIFSAGSRVGCVVALSKGERFEVHVLESSMGAAPARTTCVGPIVFPNEVLLAQYVNSGTESGGHSVIELYALDDAGGSALIYTRVQPFDSRYELRDVGTDIEIIATDPEGDSAARHQIVRLARDNASEVASCWAAETPVLDGLLSDCEVAIPQGTPQRLLESDTAGVPSTAGTSRVLYAGAPPASASGPRSWCVDTGAGPRWIELPPSIIAHCRARTQR